ncbi:hypothetical protein OCK74_14925 [Chitinophagaceae bacterium LB-8]|uniref:Uncharacterized protein n=1 Tax=Paraflavisolibacter caeni TaxID=2982496 RepID=A0A9X2XXK8_9BACT|nr:hypothetical protein [Paraflavisolibacter caeni]MCU7550412.1 hypothetical protein [Paraflavisolibacter caeni]
MCNGHNHRNGCRCGWGGEGHSGKRPEGIQIFNSHTIQRKNIHSVEYFNECKYTSYVNPNARCPVCGYPVYFYKSENGGRVFFDELGPPWPKHPCTDIKYNDVSKAINYKDFIPNWKINGWIPVTIKINTKRNPFTYIVTRLDKKYGNKIEIRNNGEEFSKFCKNDCLHQIKKVGNCMLLFSSYSILEDKEITFQIKVDPYTLSNFVNT